MEYCDMTGCTDTAEFFAEFDEDGETTTYEICESCADYWTAHKEESPKITPYANRKEAAQND
jgi:hypothetical protein